ncbi:hypothetical protein Tco_0546891 [Tanacetum coccineum]
MDVHSIPQYQKENADAVDYYVRNYLRKPSLSDHHKQMENLDVDDLEERLEETRRAQSILLSMPGFTSADLWHNDAKRCDEEFTRSMKEEKAWRASNTCTSCGRLNWDCWCKLTTRNEGARKVHLYSG